MIKFYLNRVIKRSGMRVIFRNACTLVAGSLLSSFAVANESGLKITKVGAWATGNTTFYIGVNRVIGPESCRSSLIKVDLGKDTSTQNVLMELDSVRTIALAALQYDLNVEIRMAPECLYGNPSIEQIWIYR